MNVVIVYIICGLATYDEMIVIEIIAVARVIDVC